MVTAFLNSIKNTRLPKNRNDIFALCITCFLFASALSWLVYANTSFKLTSFPHRLFGESVAIEIDAAKRQPLYFTLLLTFGASFTVLFCLLAKAFDDFKERFSSKGHDITFEKNALIGTGTLLTLYMVMAFYHNGYKLPYTLFSYLLYSITLCILVRWTLLACNKPSIARFFVFKENTLGFFFLFMGIAYSIAAYKSLPIPFNQLRIASSLSTYKILSLIVLPISIVFAPFDTKNTILRACSPLLLLLLSNFFVTEIQYITRAECLKPLYIVLSAVLLCASIGMYILKRNQPVRITKLMKYWYYPVLLTAIFYNYSFTFSYSPVLDDYLHPGSSIHAIQQLFTYGKIPFIDQLPSRGLWDCIPGLFYMITHGNFSPSEYITSFTWHLPFLIITCAIFSYFFLSRMLPYGYAFILTVALNYNANWYYNLLPLIVMPYPWIVRNFTFKRALILWSLTAAAFLWMPSLGKAVTLGTWLFLVIAFINEPKKLLKIALPSFLVFYGTAGALYTILTMLRGQSILDIYAWIKSYAIVEFILTGGACSSVVPCKNALALATYVFIPLLLVSVCLLFAYRKVAKIHIRPQQWLILALTTSAMILFTRTLGRHALIESIFTSAIWSYPILVLLPVLSPFRARLYMPAWVLASMPIIYMLYPLTPITNTAFMHPIIKWEQGTQRLKYVNKTDSLIDFLKTNLNENETFIETANSMALYPLADKPNPSFLHATHVCATDAAQKAQVKKFEKLYEQGQVPFFIVDGLFSCAHVDNLSISSQYYRFAEFLYKNYEPYADILRWEVWKAKTKNLSTIKKDCSENEGISIPLDALQTCSTHNMIITPSNEGLHLKTFDYDPHMFDFFTKANIKPIPVTEDDIVQCKVRTTYQGQSFHGQVYFEFDNIGYTENTSDLIVMDCSTEPIDYSFIISIPKGAKYLKNIRFDPPENGELNVSSISVTINPQPLKPLPIRQSAKLGFASYIWAHKDPYSAIKNNPVITLVSDLPIAPNQHTLIPLPSYTPQDEYKQYLHLRIVSPEGGRMTLSIYDKDSNMGVCYFSLKKSSEPVDYLVRVSALYAWLHKETCTVLSDTPTYIESIKVLDGD